MPITKARLRISDYNKNRKANISKTERRVQAVSLSLTSMVDMFAILVIFLLINSSTVTQWIELGHDIQLPKARAAEEPKKAATIMVSRSGIYGGGGEGVRLASLQTVTQGPFFITPVRNYLSRENDESRKNGYVNVVADQEVPYGVIKRLIATCQEAGFGNVNLAVQPRGGSGK